MFAKPAVAKVPVRSSLKPAPPPPPPSPAATPPRKKTPEEKAETKRQAGFRKRGRWAMRALAALDGRESEVVIAILELNGGTAWPWRHHLHRMFAKRFALSPSLSRAFLTSLRRTLGLPILAGDKDGPELMTREWREAARATDDWGVLAPLRPSDAIAAARTEKVGT